MSKQVATTADAQKYIEAAYRVVLDQAEAEAVEVAKKSTIATRKAALAKAVQSLDLDTLTKVESTMAEYVPHLATVQMEESRELTSSEKLALAEEYVRFELASEFLATRRDTLKELFFAHFDATVGEHTNGEVVVEEVGRVFRREGAGRTDPTVDTEALKAKLGEDAHEVFEVVEVPEQVIPAHTEEVFSEERLIKYAAKNPEALEIIREVLIPGKQKPERFVVRKAK